MNQPVLNRQVASHPCLRDCGLAAKRAVRPHGLSVNAATLTGVTKAAALAANRTAPVIITRAASDEGMNMDAVDELVAMILERLEVLGEINKSTFNSDHPTNCGPVQRWIEDVRGKVTRFNLKMVKVVDNPAFAYDGSRSVSDR